MIKYYDLIQSPIITESTNKKMETHNEYAFKVKKDSNKIEIKKAIEKIFQVKVASVNIINVLPKFKRKGKYQGYTSACKKAIVKLIPGQRIKVFNEDK
ncbi:50S ribosomal protein L23 [Columbia Basin potato purple top phytoplasma]|uniref:Large ribosomal subunit protein uL23 n=1 Tax=Columbia Basin potato purple top phytoplasma TaxID=307134 RepID=A0ABT5LBE4_9MOLU|nr:50S ribosomal protein L23 [Columbia Basin potato purple top phytoplasma]MDC9031983.1 50S ribosomal protein L23 [Columbia Basin potato purple top phytoplasma]